MADQEKNVGMESVTAKWQEMGRSRQITLAVVGAALVVFMVLMISYFSRPQYATLYSNLEPAQASPLLEHLREKGVAYQLEDFGSTIKVPQEKADELRIEMAGLGMPFAQGIGFELFDEERLGMTDFERQVKMQRALQEELRRTISSLDSVMQARVHLALPEPRVFLQERSEPSAAVYLQLNPFVGLKKEQVRGIVFLVSSSVEDLQPTNITVIDSQGNILYDAVTTDDPFMAVADSTLKQMEVKRGFEKELERRMQVMLERVFGPGKVLALVTAELDFDARETSLITFDEQGVPRSTHVMEEEFEGEGPPLGEVGEANYPGYMGVVHGGDSSYQRSEEIVNYEIGESTERVIAAPGKVLRLNTSVVVDTGQNNVTAEQIEQVNTLVATAIGFDEERGDQINVQGMNFDTTHVDEMEAAMAQIETEQRQEELFRQAVLGAAALIAFVLILLAIRRRKRLREEMELAMVPEGPTLEELLAMEEEDYSAALSPEETTQGRARKIIEKNPEAAVSVLRTWMVED